MADDIDLEQVIKNVAAQPQSTSIDGTTISQHSLPDLMDAADRQAANTAAKKNHRGIRFTKLKPPGTL